MMLGDPMSLTVWPDSDGRGYMVTLSFGGGEIFATTAPDLDHLISVTKQFAIGLVTRLVESQEST